MMKVKWNNAFFKFRIKFEKDMVVKIQPCLLDIFYTPKIQQHDQHSELPTDILFIRVRIVEIVKNAQFMHLYFNTLPHDQTTSFESWTQYINKQN